MKPETLASIKRQVRKFHKLYVVLEQMWNDNARHGCKSTYPEAVQVSVILNNIGIDSTNCVGYDHDQEVAKVEKLIDILKQINEYHGYVYMINYAWNEVECIYIGETMSEEDEDINVW